MPVWLQVLATVCFVTVPLGVAVGWYRSTPRRLVADFQRLTDAYTELEASRLLLMNAAYKKEQGRSFSKEASMAKLNASEAAEQVCRDAIQTLGGYGYLADFPVERLYRDARVASIYEGTNDIQCLVISRELVLE